jgi:hypothetical protein
MSIMTHVRSCPHNPVSEFVGDSGPHWIVSDAAFKVIVRSKAEVGIDPFLVLCTGDALEE